MTIETKKRSPVRRVAKILIFLLLAVALIAALYFWLTRARAPDHADIAYAPTSQAQKLDIYLPKGKGPFPVVVYAHGGAFKFGSKRDIFGDFKGNIETMNAAGIALASIDYRMSGETVFPAAVQDMKSAVRFLRANASRYHLAPDRFALWGKSAGAHIALMAGMSSEVALFDDPAAPHRDQSDQVSAIISMYGPTDFLQMDSQLKTAGCGAADLTHNNADSPESLYLGRKITGIAGQVAQSNPMTYASPTTPPLLLQHGEKDCTVPAGQSRILAVAVNAIAPARATLEIKPGAGHGDSVFEEKISIDRVVSFIQAAFNQASAAPVQNQRGRNQ
jgi:acetyl esterase/lipase